ncbi:outer membrane beta-barrel protein [Hymenobacter swuensis]|uniref:Outer membrane protein beta-barrel domain-containing protein n=1 Tax=Hymenobacter swuensis DY53 TaxID=1227739 RepID=W8EY59_9BACT|nr:outer membrane beta-barrel protein [Hymenobacter swuensis]AHJ97488.1 hypothetical protein Hsw_1893 [Hymenobacter swuensis DY53]
MLSSISCPGAGFPLATTVLLLLSAPDLRAQQLRPAPITGAVRTATGSALEYATVTLHRATDSVVVKTEFSDAAGQFQLQPPVIGRYLVSVSQLGYGRGWAGPLDVTAGPATPLAFRLVTGTATQLKEVTVTGQRPVFERLADRTIVNVEGSLLSAGNTTLDVLGRAPGMVLDANDNLMLRGKTGLLVLIDGKRVPLTGAELASMLQALPAEQIRSIELITNPPAKYDAQGGAGVISISLKKDQRQGFNGSTNAAYGRGRYGKFTSGLNLNYRRQKLSLYSSYAYTDRQLFQELRFDRTYLQDGQPVRFVTQRNDTRSHIQSHTWRAGIEYSFTDRTTLGAVVSGLASRLPSLGRNYSELYDAQGQLTAQLEARNHRTLLTPNVAANLSLRHQFRKDSLGTPELTMDADLARYDLTRTLDLQSSNLLSSYYTPSRLLGDQNGRLTIGSAKADYVRSLRHGLRLETGLKTSRVSSDNDVLFEREKDGVRQVDAGLTNRFRYEETISAAYVSLTRSRPTLTLTAGLRGEHTATDGRQQIGSQEFSRRYFQLFPSLRLTRTVTDHHEVGFSLSRRLDRPTYNQLNPFRSYVDPLSYRVGNPALWPQLSTQAELTHTFNHKFSTALSYTRTRRPILSVYLLDTDGLVAATDVNLNSQDYWSLTFTAPLEPAPWWKLYASAEAFYIRFQGSLEGAQLPQSQPGAILSASNSFTLPHGWSAELNGSYNSLERFGFQTVRAFGQVGAGVQKSFGPTTVKLNATDIFYTTPLRVTSRYRPLTETFRSAQDSRVVTAALSYRFGNEKVPAARRRASGAEDEKRRAGNVQ